VSEAARYKLGLRINTISSEEANLVQNSRFPIPIYVFFIDSFEHRFGNSFISIIEKNWRVEDIHVYLMDKINSITIRYNPYRK
jgi:hypothetical protein